MTVSALHHPLVDTMFHRHGELWANVRVASVAEIRLSFRQQELRHGRFVNGVAGVAGYFGLSVRTAPDVATRQVLGMAGQAVVEHLPRIHQAEGTDGRLPAARLKVFLPGTVATLTARLLGRKIAGGNALVMWVPIEIQPHVGMAGLAGLAADVTICRRVRWSGLREQGQSG